MKKKYLIGLLALLLTLMNSYAQSCSAPNKNLNIQIAYVTDGTIEGIISSATPPSDGYVVVRRLSADNNATFWPDAGSSYNAGDIDLGGEIVSSGSSLTFSDSGLSKLTTCYYFIFPYNDCGDGTKAYYTNVLVYPTQTKNDPCYNEDFEGVTFGGSDRFPGSGFCDYVAAPDDWIISKKSCIEDTNDHGNADSNHAAMYGSSDYLIPI